MENTSGSGSAAVVPAGVGRWNWGAFWLNWIWGIGNNTLIALLVFVPFVNIVMPFVLGAKGNAWAWRNKRWESVDAFRATQRKWALWGWGFFGVSVLFIAGMVALIIGILAALKGSDAYQMGVRALNANPAAVQILGQPISAGIPLGNISVSGSNGQASLSFSATGPKGKGTVHVRASKSRGQWRIDEAVLQDAQGGQRVNIAE
jgi:hypothetical protein